MLAFIDGTETDSKLTLMRLCRAPPITSSTNQRPWGRSQNKLKAAWQMCFLWVESSCSLWLVALQHFPERMSLSSHGWHYFLCHVPQLTSSLVIRSNRFLWRDFIRPGFDSSRVGGASRSLPVADVITLLIGHAADQLPVVFLVSTETKDVNYWSMLE